MAVFVSKGNPYVAPRTFHLPEEYFSGLISPYSITGKIVDIHSQSIYSGRIYVDVYGKIERIEKLDNVMETQYIMPGFVDSHVHIESSMLMPSTFARAAVRHGVVAAVCDPHEIANVLGLEGVRYFIDNGKKSGFKFFFGAPSCVPAAANETAGANITADDIADLMQNKDIYFLGEMMNYPGVINRDPEVTNKIKAAIDAGKVIDGHAPGLGGDDLLKYVSAGITTDHECMNLHEAEQKIALGMKVLIREGSAAKNFEALSSLIETHPDSVMLCTDDIHPDDLQLWYIDELVRKGLGKGISIFNLLKAASVNPIRHYKLPVGQLREGDTADFIVTNSLDSTFEVLQTYLSGRLIYDRGKVNLAKPDIEIKNNFHALRIKSADIEVKATGSSIRLIEVIDKELYTKSQTVPATIIDGLVQTNVEQDILKLVAMNRYKPNAKPAVAFIRGFGLKGGALCSTVSHDSHNLIAVGTDDDLIVKAMNAVIDEKGGIAVSTAQGCKIMPLPIAGILSDKEIGQVAEAYHNLNTEAKTVLGSTLTAPFMTLAFMSLIVIPELKLSDKGLFDVIKFKYTELFSD